MELIFLCSSFPRYAGDGAAVFLLNLAHALVDTGCHIHVIAPDDRAVDPGWTPNGLSLHRFRYAPRSLEKLAYGSGILPNLRQHPLRWLLVPGFVVAMAWQLIRVARATEAPIIHAHWIIPGGWLAVLMKPVLRSRVIVSAHGSDIYSLRSGLWRLLRNWTLDRADAWTANTMATRDAAGSPHAHWGTVIPMGVPVRHFDCGDRLREQRWHDHEPSVILFVGRLIDWKGVDVLIQAFARLDSKHRSELWIAGDGPQRAALEKLARRLGIAERVRFLGQQRYDDLPALYSSANIFVAPSRDIPGAGREGQGTVILEAMASGCCVIGAAAGGIPEVIEHDRTGILVPPNDPATLAQAILMLLNDPDTRNRLVQAAHAHVLRKYDWSEIAPAFEGLYKRLI
jgi:glycosyltransferase involved in cell wall biosynthesis